MKIIQFLLLMLPLSSFSQGEVLLVGNIQQLCIDSLFTFAKTSDRLPDEIEHYSMIFVFSNARSVLSVNDQTRLIAFLKSGKGIYLGSENWPLQAESNQMTELLFTKKSWGNFDTDLATADSTGLLKDHLTFPAGNTTVAFPLDYRLKVEAWVNDEPLILSGQVEGGRLIIDGGYSRFYCSSFQESNRQIMKCFVDFLK